MVKPRRAPENLQLSFGGQWFSSYKNGHGWNWHHSPDRLILAVVYALVIMGLILMFSASGILAENWREESTYFLKRQVIAGIAGLVCLHGIAVWDYRQWHRLVPVVVGGVLVLLLLVLIPGVGHCVNGACRWFRVGGISVQPGEFAKLAVVIYLASFLARRQDRLTSFFSGLVPPLLVAGSMAGLVLLEPDMGTAVVLGLLVGGLLFLGGAPLVYLGALVVASVPVVLALILGVGYRLKRVLSFWDPWGDPMGAGYQLIQSYVALGNGGLLGVGLGNGRQKLFFLPEAHADFVLASIGEELGLLGTWLLLGLFLLLVVKGFQIAREALDPFGRYLASGVTLLIGIQVLINAGVVTGLLPTKGLTLPFVSYGGSSLVINLTAIGMLLSVARVPRQRKPPLWHYYMG
ncbi:MAG: putative lipid II flippase FtsW [Nitrospirae bacterium]|nr:MAG: putative lipid II flippase FtsW [Nitrospirota bacterium]